MNRCTSGHGIRRLGRRALQVALPCLTLAAVATAQLGTPQRVPQTSVAGVSSAEQPRIAGTGSRFHVVWQDFRDPEWAIYYRGGTIGMLGGLTLDVAADVRLSAAGVSTLVNANDPAITTDGSSTVFVTWRASDVELGQERIMFVRSNDQGANWSTPVALSLDVPFVSRPVICADGFQRVYVAWTQYDPVNRTDRVFLRASVDNGANWPNPAAGVSTGLSAGAAVYQQAPQLVCARSFLGVAYVDDRNHPAGQVFFQSSTN